MKIHVNNDQLRRTCQNSKHVNTSGFIVSDSFADAQALFIKRINEESSCFALARLLIFSQAASMEGELRISSNLDWAVSRVSTISSVLS